MAILLDEFMMAADIAKQQKKMSLVFGAEMTLDPLLAKLNQFTTPHDLAAMIENLYKVARP